jgi:hypothetical protein
LAKEKPLTQEDFLLKTGGKDTMLLIVRGQELLSVPLPGDPMAPENRQAIRTAVVPLTDVINAYPCVKRPFMWRTPTAMHAQGN